MTRYPFFEERRGDCLVSTDPARLDVDVIHGFLHDRAYWSAGIPREVLKRAIDQSLCFGVYQGDRQVGFARVITDQATFAYLCDVFISEEVRGQGLGKWLIACITGHPALQGLRRFILATRDAHSLYRQHGFTPLAAPERWMEIRNPDVYQSWAGR